MRVNYSEMYSTKSITPEIREKIPNGLRQFDICECCGLNQLTCDEKDNWKSIVFRKRFNLVLCDECTDKKDGTWNMQIYEKNGVVKAYYPMKRSR